MKDFLNQVVIFFAVFAVIACLFLVTEQDRIDQLTLLCQIAPNDDVCATLPKE